MEKCKDPISITKKYLYNDIFLGTLRDRGGMHLITADGSVDCQGINELTLLAMREE